VIAPLLIIQRVASKNALTSDTIAPGSIGSFRAGSRRESTGGGSVLPVEYPMGSEQGMGTGKLDVRVETLVDFHRDMV